MKRITIFLALALVALTPCHAAAIELRDGDVVAFAGGTDLARVQKDGRLEAALTKRFPEALISLQGEPAGDQGFEAIFDGKTLSGWHAIPAKTERDWVVHDGIIVGTGSQNRQSFLIWKERDLTDFELELKYRLPAGGNTGIEIRAQPDPSHKRSLIGYHADIGHAGIGDAILGAWDFHFAGREEYSCKRGVRLAIDEDGKTSRAAIKDPFVPADIRERDWNHVRVVAKGRNFTFFINGKPASEFTDHAKVGRFDSGGIALQIHDKGMRVEFKDIQLKKLK